MNLLRTLFFAVVFIAPTALYSQAPVAQGGAAKIGVFASDRFSDPNNGIKRLVAALRTVETEFKPRQDELAGLISRFEQLRRELSAPPAGSTQAALSTKANQAEVLQLDIKRKQEDARTAYTKRLTALTDPIRLSVFNALTVYAKGRGIDVLMDGSKFPDGLYLINPAAEITQAFIADYNAKNP